MKLVVTGCADLRRMISASARKQSSSSSDEKREKSSTWQVFTLAPDWRGGVISLNRV